MNKSYSEMLKFKTLKERYNYLKLNGNVGKKNFGFDRYLNQDFYKSSDWRRIRNKIIIRDNGCDLGVEGEEILGNIYVHHINPITLEDLKNRSSKLYDPENLISCSYNTHQAITYGIDNLMNERNFERAINDTCPWRK